MHATKIDKATLVRAFREAAAAALAADPGPDGDGETCNFDTPAVRLEGVRGRFVEECAALAGISASAFHWFGGRRWFFINVPAYGKRAAGPSWPRPVAAGSRSWAYTP
jgi:hypothetical protein